MKVLESVGRPSKIDQKVAAESYNILSGVLDQIDAEQTEIEIEEADEKIKVPMSALKLFTQVLKGMSQGKIISIVPIEAELTTQAAAEMIGCSRPHLVKLLEEGQIPFTKIGKHRRIRLEDVINYKEEMKERQKQYLTDMMNADEETGLYDS
jgi:excisionase family DNA binding protein